MKPEERLNVRRLHTPEAKAQGVEPFDPQKEMPPEFWEAFKEELDQYRTILPREALTYLEHVVTMKILDLSYEPNLSDAEKQVLLKAVESVEQVASIIRSPILKWNAGLVQLGISSTALAQSDVFSWNRLASEHAANKGSIAPASRYWEEYTQMAVGVRILGEPVVISEPDRQELITYLSGIARDITQYSLVVRLAGRLRLLDISYKVPDEVYRISKGALDISLHDIAELGEMRNQAGKMAQLAAELKIATATEAKIVNHGIEITSTVKSTHTEPPPPLPEMPKFG